MINGLNPALILIFGGLLLSITPRHIRNIGVLLLPVVSLLQLLTTPLGNYGELTLFGQQLVTMRVDNLSFIWAVIFHIAAFIGGLYALHVKDPVQDVAAMVYAGAAIGATLAGDLATLFIYWELTAVSSVFLIWARRTERALKVGTRYLIIQVLSGVLLLIGLLVQVNETGSLAFDFLGIESLAGKIIFFAFAIKCAFPFLHNWLQDAYPEATVTGTVILSAFTTKLAVYAFARGYAGVDVLIWIGAIMTAFPIFFAVIENDLRKVLSYSLNNQLGFMIVGVGIGTELAINGTAAHAFAHILYKALLFMAMGAVLFKVGTIKASELGGLYKYMPKTTVFCIIGAMAISAFPLMSGFVTKSMVLSAAGNEHLTMIWLILMFASAGVMDHSGIKIPFFTFFAHDQTGKYLNKLEDKDGKLLPEAPTNMLWAMGITAFLCIAIGIYPAPLYAILPFDIDYNAYDTTHVVTQLQLLMFSALAFTLMFRFGIYPPELKSVNLDFDWTYRKLIPKIIKPIGEFYKEMHSMMEKTIKNTTQSLIQLVSDTHGENSHLGSQLSSSSMIFWVMVLFAMSLITYLFF